MGTTTSNYNLIKPDREDFYNIVDQNGNMDIIDTELKKLSDIEEASKISINKLQTDTESNSNSINSISELISSGAVQTPRLTLGANKISIPDVPVSPRIEFTGMSYVNLLGKDGDCEDVSKWNVYAYSTYALDTTVKVFGSCSIKITLTGGSGGFAKAVDGFLDKTKYYFISAYLANGNGTSIMLAKDASNGGLHRGSSVTSTSMTRTGIKVAPADFASSGNNIVVLLQGASGQYGYADGIMVMEISSSEYSNLSIDELLAKYPYVESYGVLINPYFENRRYNLVRNGNCEEGIGYWKPIFNQAKISVENNKFKVVFTGGGDGFKQCIVVKQNTNYYLKGNVSGDKAWFYARGVQTATTLGNANTSSKMFNTGDNTEIEVVIYVPSGSNVCYFDSIMLVEGSTVPAEYKSCDLQRFVVEGQFTQDDKVVIENGKVSGELNWKHCTLYGKDYSWQYNGDISGGKTLSIPLVNFQNAYSYDRIGNKLVKPDGSMANEGAVGGGVIGNFNLTTAAGGFIYNISDVESGWAETINPNNDEVKAFMNGWRAGTNNGSRYTGWVSIVDNTIPSSLVVTASYGTNASGQNKLNVVDSTKFAVNDWIYFVGDDKWVNTCQISAISGNQLTLTGNLTGGASASNPIAKQDQTQKQIDWVKNNIAPNYKGYQLHYKLANLEPVTDINVQIKGEIWELEKGDNYVYVDNGIMLGEITTPALDTDTYYIGIQNSTVANSPFKYPAQNVDRVYRNLIYDPKWALLNSSDTQFGYAAILTGDYDSYAIYTTDYKILKTLYAQSFGSLALSYKQSIASTLESHSRELEQKQKGDSSLNNIASMKIFENINYGYLTNGFRRGIQGTRTFTTAPAQTSVEVFIPFKVQKVTNPYIFVGSWSISIIDNIGYPTELKSSDLIYGSPFPKIYNKDYVVMRFLIPAGTLADNALNYGAYVSLNIDADCRGRI